MDVIKLLKSKRGFAESRHKTALRVLQRHTSAFLAASFLAVLTVQAALLSGCAPEQEPEELIVVDQTEAESVYTLAIAERGDVIKTRDVSCSYKQLEEQDVSFAVSGKRVSEVCVSLDDVVEKGQVLARLGDNGASDRIDELEYQIARNRLLLAHSRENEQGEIEAIRLQYEYRSGRTEAEAQAANESMEAVRQRYGYEQEDLADAISLDSLELESLKKETADSQIYAEIDGTVSWIASNLEGSTSVKDTPVIRIVDGSECLFTVLDIEQADIFHEGEPVDLRISVGPARGDYKLLPWQMDTWESEGRLLFTFAEEYGVTVEMDTSGTITVVTDKREDVLHVPPRAVHTADGKSFVYCLGEDGMREIRWVETGLHGDDSTEIISGLAEGETVILR